ncbi:MAG: PD-(D/E)XK nuclease family protein [Woeseiaceae bacterium]
MFDWLDDALEGSSEVVTASRRLARVLQTEHGKRMAASGARVWRSATILSLNDWLSRLLADSDAQASLPVQITAQQSRILWERCLRREISDPLLNIRMLSRQSRDTWNRLQQWQVPASECLRQARNRDQVLFAKAATSYCSILEREGWLDESGLAALAAQEIAAGHCRLPAELLLAGFDRITPQLQTLIDTINESTGSAHQVTVTEQSSTVALCSAENSDSEFRAAGVWAREQLAQSPQARLAIVVTNLEQDAQRSLRLIKEGMIPGWQNADARENGVINVSYGRKLIEYPAISIALLALRWLFEDLSTVDISRLLQTTMLGSDSSDARIRLELRLRQQPDQSWSPKRLLSEFASWGDEFSQGDVQERIQRIAERRDQIPKRLSAAEWVTLFDDILKQLQWPGDASLQSAEFQLINRWRELLNDFARLDLVSTGMSAAEALGRLSNIASEVIFQPESIAAAVQVMGPLEAAGLQFDKLWVTGLSANSWPPNGRAMPLVSRELQRERVMPDATPAESLQYAQRVIARLLASAPEVVLSYARSNSDAQQTPSELLAAYSIKDIGDVVDPGWHARNLCDVSAAESIGADPVPPVQRGEVIQGGAASIQRQFVEPFAAFVTGRLGVRSLWPIASGLPASIRGSLIHSALYRLYEDCPSSEQISAWDAVEVDSRIEQAVRSAFRYQKRNADSVLLRMLSLEQQRVVRLLHDVVALDSQRERFDIASVEKEIAADIGDLSLRLRIDRVDVDDDGQSHILDYKTGAPKRLLDRDKNPNDMQLVVYAYVLNESVGGLALLNIDSRAVELDAAGRTWTPKLDWDTTLDGWKAQVELAAQEIAAGDVRIQAFQSVQAARALGLLSRFQELVHE